MSEYVLPADGESVAMNTGASSASTQRVVTASNSPDVVALESMNTKTPSLGQALAAASVPVVLASDSAGAASAGDVAHDAADSGNPVKIGMKAISAWITAVTNGDRANAISDLFGRLITTYSPRNLRGRQVTSIATSTSETTIVSAGASGIKRDIFRLKVANTGAASVNVTIRDSTAGTITDVYALPAGQTVGFSGPSCDAEQQTAAASNWTAQCDVATTTIKITAEYVEVTD